MANTKTAVAERSASADLLKAISIAAVVFIHADFLIPFSPSYNFILAPIFRFCVPVFIMLWAYFAEKSIARSSKPSQYLLTRFYRLLIPFVFWSSIYFLLTANVRSLNILGAINKYWTGYGWSGQYFFVILFQLLILFLFIRHFTRYLEKRPAVIVVLSIVFYIAVTYSPFGRIPVIARLSDRPFVYWLPYVILGIIYARHGIQRKLALPVIVVIMSLVAIPLEYKLLRGRFSPYLVPSVFMVTVLIVNSMLAKTISFDSTRAVDRKLVTLLSQNTMGIFCLNPLVIIVLSSFFNLPDFNLSFQGCFIIIPVVSMIVVLAISLAITLLLKKIRLGILVNG